MTREYFVKWIILSLCSCYWGLAGGTSTPATSLAEKSPLDVCEDVAIDMKDDFTHYVLAQIYPPAYCRSGKKLTCSKLNDAIVSPWTIHGLWPSRDKEMGPLCCDPNAGFNSASIQELLPRLNKEWMSLKRNHTFYDFWKHEWLKHGTCCPDSLHPEYNYFNFTLTLFENHLNLDKFLLKANIKPSSNPYKIKRILSAFGEEGVVSELICSNIDAKNMLIEVRICLNKDFGRMRCPRPTNYTRCGTDVRSHVLYIPWPHPDDLSG